MGAEIAPRELREALAFPEDYGPSEWGPIPYLPDPDFLVQRMESQWGDLLSYRGISTSAAGDCFCRLSLTLDLYWLCDPLRTGMHMPYMQLQQL